MKKIQKNALLWATLAFSSYSQAATITWNTVSSTVNATDIFILNIIGTDFAVGEDVEGGDLDLLFDPTVLNVLSVSVDPVWTFESSAGTIDNVAGSVLGIKAYSFASVTENFTIASIEFQAVGVGGSNSALLLSEPVLFPWASAGFAINPTFVAGDVAIAAVPVPAAVWLFGSGLLGLLGVARKKAHA